MKTPILVNAEAMAAQHSDTFSIPLRSIRERLKPGDCVKVCSPSDSGDREEPSAKSERFWVIVTKQIAPGAYVGTIDNDLLFTKGHGLRCGDEILFAAENIYEAHTEKP